MGPLIQRCGNVPDGKLGSGAFADVYRGLLLPRNTEVAVKVAKDASDKARHDLEREINFMKTLDTHPHVLVMIGYITLECGRMALVLEYCASGDLSKWLLSHAKCINAIAAQNELKTPVPGSGPYFDFVVSDAESQLSGRYLYEPCGCHQDTASVEKQLLSFAWQIADALVYLSSRKVIHRDIAARNVLLTKEVTAKICDFGLCRRSEGNVYHTKYGKLPIRWMAPEALKSGVFTEKTDIWSYGILLYEIYSGGSIPFPHVQPYEQLAVLERGERPERSDPCPETIYAFMRRCWQANPSDRPSAFEIQQHLGTILKHSSSEYGYLEFGGMTALSSDYAKPLSPPE